MNHSLLKIQDLSVKFDNTQVLEKISIEILPSRITCIIGPSGAGKSTLLKCIVRLINYSGAIYYQNSLISSYPVLTLRKDIIYVPQIPTPFPGSVKNNIRWPMSVWKIPISDTKIVDIVNLVGLDESILNKPADKISVGQLQKLSLARALALNPKILLLDEPSSALDALSKENFEHLVIKIKSSIKDITIILITHDIQQAKRIAEDMILLNEGRLLLHSKVEVFFSKLASSSDAETLKNLIKNNKRKLYL